MRSQQVLLTLTALFEKPYFTSQDVRELGVHPASVGYYIKKGLIKRIQRGIYQRTNYQNSSAFQWADLVEAVSSIKGGVICLISALAVYNLTEEIPRQHWIAIHHNTSVKAPRGTKILRYRNMELGKIEMEIEGVHVPIFDKERTIVDGFRLLSSEIAIKALKAAIAQGGKQRIDLIKLQKYAKQLRCNIMPYLVSLST